MLKIIKSERSEKHEKNQSMLKRSDMKNNYQFKKCKTHTHSNQKQEQNKKPIRYKLDLEDRYEEMNQNGDMRLKLYKSN